MNRVRSGILMLVAMVSLLLPPSMAYAGLGPLRCDGNGNPQANTALFNVGGNDDEGYCVYHGLQHIFSQIICDFVVVLDLVLDRVYCGIQYAMVDTLSILLSVYVTVFGVQLLLGTAQLVSKEIMLRLLKIAGVWVFATSSAWGIGLVFGFFISFMVDGSMWVINSLGSLYPGSVCDPSMPGVANEDVMPIYGFFDTLIYCAILGPASQADVKVVSFFIAMAVVYPPMFLMAQWWAWTTFMALVRTTMTYMMCLAAVAFLVSMTPIFLSLMLFQSTNHFFENWLRYLTSYALQVIFAFAVIILWIIVITKFMVFFSDLAALIFEYKPEQVPGPLVDPTATWAICPTNYTTYLWGLPKATCKAGLDYTLSANLIPPSDIVRHGEFLYYIFCNLITLLIITYAFKVLLDNVGQIAQSVAGPSPLPALQGGWGNSNFGSATGHHVPGALRSNGSASSTAGKSMGSLAGQRK